MTTLSNTFTALAGMLLFATPAHAAAFDCSYAKMATEQLLCQDQTLSQLDEANARVFYAVQSTIAPYARHEWSVIGRDWLNARNACGFDTNCVWNRYAERFQYMCGIAATPPAQYINDCVIHTAAWFASRVVNEGSSREGYPGTVGVDAWDPDPYLALRTDPSPSYGQRIAKLRNGEELTILNDSRSDGWWFVRAANGQQGWAKSGAGATGTDRIWIHTDDNQ